MPPLQRFIIALTGGLQDSRALAQPSDLVKLHNFTLFRGRFALRAPVREIASVASESHILDIATHLDGVWILTYNTTNDDVDLYSMAFPSAGDWGTPTHVTQVHNTVTTRPSCRLTSFSGGTEESPEDRIFITDYNQELVTKFWNDSGSSLVTLQSDFEADGTAQNAYFSLMAPYQFHLWGTGFYSDYGTGGDQLRPEMLRFSQPGLIPNVDPAGGAYDPHLPGTPNASTKEWFTFDYRNVGRRGDKIKALSYSLGNLMVFQKGSTHAIFGYGQDSWAAKQISDHIGCVGPNAATASDTGGLCFFWSHDGPFATDGSSLQPLGEDIRQHVIDHASDERVSASYSPDDGVVYFTLYPPDLDTTASDQWPEHYLAYDTHRKRWSDGSWLKGASTPIPVSVLFPATSREIAEAPGPIAPPGGTSLSATAVNHEWISVKWDRGDLASDAKTEIYRDTSTGLTPGPGNLVHTNLNPQYTRYNDSAAHGSSSPPAPRTTYYYKLRHWRNGLYSSASSEVNAKTWHEPAEDVYAKPAVGGVELSYTIPATVTGTCDVKIQRSRAPDYFDFYDVTTVSGQSSGAKTYTDTGQHVSITAGAQYMYTVTLTAAGETDSQDVGIGYPVIAGGSGTTPDITVTGPSITTWGPSANKITYAFFVNWTDLEPPESYQIWAYEDYGSGYERTDTFNPPTMNSGTRGYWSYKAGGDDRLPCPGTSQLKVRFNLMKRVANDRNAKEFLIIETVTMDDAGGYYDPCSAYSP